MEGFEDRRSLQAWTPIAPEDAPRAAKALYLRLAAHGWEIELLHATTLHKASVYATSSETNAKGDVKKAAHVVDHFALQASLDKQGHKVARALVVWAKERPAEGAKAKPALFVDAHSWDMVQDEIEFHRKATGFDEWVSILAPKPSKKKKEPEPDALAAELSGGTWNA